MRKYYFSGWLILLAGTLFFSSCSKKSSVFSSSPPKSQPVPQLDTRKYLSQENEIKKEKPITAPIDNSVIQVIDYARSFLGTPYRYGGTTKNGMDCSGLIYMSFLSAGINMPRTSSDQGNHGKQVDIIELQPGDLVFFARRRGQSRISHVGLVTEVNGPQQVMFIHSSSSRGVVENNLWSDYYQGVFLRARRVF